MALQTTEGGASVLKAAEVLEKLGVAGGRAIPKATLPELEAGIANGRSAMVGVNVPGIGPHAMVVDRIAEGRVFLRDPLPVVCRWPKPIRIRQVHSNEICRSNWKVRERGCR